MPVYHRQSRRAPRATGLQLRRRMHQRPAIIHLATQRHGLWGVGESSMGSYRQARLRYGHITKALSKIKPARSSRALPALYKGKGAHAAACFKIRNALYNRRPARYNVQEIAAARQTCLPGECEVQAGKMACQRAACSKPGAAACPQRGILGGMYMRHLIDRWTLPWKSWTGFCGWAERYPP